MNPESLSTFQDAYGEQRAPEESLPQSVEDTIEISEPRTEEFEQSEKINEYTTQNAEVSLRIEQVSEQKDKLKKSLDNVRDQLYEGDVPINVTDPSLELIDKELYKLQQEKIKASSNYPGDWTLLLRKRMLDPITKEKFVRTRSEVMPNMKQGEIPKSDGLSFEKPKSYASHYQSQIDAYDENIERIFSLTHVGDAKDFSRENHHLGSGGIGQEGNVFFDAQKDVVPLTVRQKNIIESHEKGHGLRDFVTVDAYDFKHLLDYDVVYSRDVEKGERVRGYLLEAEEIAERMAQLRNYFGHNASDVFTQEHLEFAKENYIKDTGLDNNMTTFFDAVTDNTRDRFIETINTYPL